MSEALNGPLVSVIIAAYNAAFFITPSIYSACAQTHSNVEVLVVNDGSTDATANVVAALAATDPRIRLIDLARNGGVSNARNAGIREAKGEWIAILDSDDRFAPERIERLLQVAVEQRLDLVADNLQLRHFATDVPIGNAFPADWMGQNEDVSLKFMLERDIPGIFEREIGFIKPLIRRAFLLTHNILYPVDIWAGEDFLLYAECLRAGGRMRFIGDALYIYAVRPSSVSTRGNANFELKKVNQRLLDNLLPSERDCVPLLELRRAMLDYRLFNWHLKQRQFASALALARVLPASLLRMKFKSAVFGRFRGGNTNPNKMAYNTLQQQRLRGDRAIASK